MAADRMTLTVEYRLAWWLRWYAAALVWFGQTFGLRPDVEKFAGLAVRTARFRIDGGPWRKM